MKLTTAGQNKESKANESFILFRVAYRVLASEPLVWFRDGFAPESIIQWL